jgi:hypothetical protein
MRNKRGQLVRRSAWIILDGTQHIATGCLASEAADAERKLTEYIAAQCRLNRRENDIEEIPIADVLSIYFDDCGAHQNPTKLNGRLRR